MRYDEEGRLVYALKPYLGRGYEWLTGWFELSCVQVFAERSPGTDPFTDSWGTWNVVNYV